VASVIESYNPCYSYLIEDAILAQISKLDAARRQLDAAIESWLKNEDVLIAHALHMAALGVLTDLDRYERPDEFKLFWDGLPAVVRMSHRRVANFLKHADRDPHETIEEPSHDDHEWSIGLAISFYRRLSENNPTPLMTAFDLMMKSVWPEFFNIAADPDPDIEWAAQHAGKMMRDSPDMRRRNVSSTLKLIEEGLFPANADLQRTERV